MRVGVTILIIGLVLSPVPSVRGAEEGAEGIAPQAAVVEYDRRAAEVLIDFSETLGEIGEADSGPQMQVHGDGLVVVSFPPYMKRAGTYTMRLAPAELDALLASLLGKGLADFDEARVGQEKRKAEMEKQTRAAQRTVSFSSDPSRISIELNVDRYVSADRKATARDVDRVISWSGLRDDARRYRDVAALQNLAAADSELRSLMESPELVRVD